MILWSWGTECFSLGFVFFCVFKKCVFGLSLSQYQVSLASCHIVMSCTYGLTVFEAIIYVSHVEDVAILSFKPFSGHL